MRSLSPNAELSRCARLSPCARRAKSYAELSRTYAAHAELSPKHARRAKPVRTQS